MKDLSKEPSWFPVVLNLQGGHVVVVGGGGVAANKVRLLLGVRTPVYVIASHFGEALDAMRGAKNLHFVACSSITLEELKPYFPHCRLAYIALESQARNEEVARGFREENIPVCCVDSPTNSTFITPAIVRRGDVQIAISTGGASPVLARVLRQLVERVLPHGLEKLAQFMKELRQKIAKMFPDMRTRRRLWEDFIGSQGSFYASQGQYDKAREVLDNLAHAPGEKTSGEIWLVGAGPGSPDLLTLSAWRLLQKADYIFYDNLVNLAVLEYARRDAQCVYVGKQKGRSALTQEGIHHAMIARAKRGARVLRLKGGDPFVFGRGGEEMEAIAKAGINCRIIPAITAANGCAAYGGIPLTHRDCAQQCLLITGHSRTGEMLDVAWEGVALKGQTLVIYMGLSHIEKICDQLIEHGLPTDWPAALVVHGTLPSQQVIVGTLTSLPDKIKGRGVSSPALVIVGEVVNHRVPVGAG